MVIKLVAALAGLLLLLLLGLALVSVTEKRPAYLGVRQGSLAACPESPNCVSSQAEREDQRVEPFDAGGDPKARFARLRQALLEMPRTRLADEAPGYVHTETVTGVFRFTDDTELWLDEDAGVIHVRAAARSGYSDFGVNRARVEALREALR